MSVFREERSSTLPPERVISFLRLSVGPGGFPSAVGLAGCCGSRLSLMKVPCR